MALSPNHQNLDLLTIGGLPGSSFHQQPSSCFCISAQSQLTRYIIKMSINQEAGYHCKTGALPGWSRYLDKLSPVAVPSRLCPPRFLPWTRNTLGLSDAQ